VNRGLLLPCSQLPFHFERMRIRDYFKCRMLPTYFYRYYKKRYEIRTTVGFFVADGVQCMLDIIPTVNVICYLITMLKGKVVPVLNWLITMPWRRMGEWMYRSTFSGLGTSCKWVPNYNRVHRNSCWQNFGNQIREISWGVYWQPSSV
jgi:hypothetical protein